MLSTRCLLNRSKLRGRGILPPACLTVSVAFRNRVQSLYSEAAISARWTARPPIEPRPLEPTTSETQPSERESAVTSSTDKAAGSQEAAPCTRSYAAFDVRMALLRSRPHLPFDVLRDTTLPFGERLRMIDSLRTDGTTRLLMLECLLDAHLKDSTAAAEVLEPARTACITRLLDPATTEVESWRATLRAYHALLARLRRLGVDLPADWLARGLLLSARARDASSLRQFAGQLGGTYPRTHLEPESAHADLLPSTVSALRLWIRSDVGLLHSPGDSRRAAQLCAVLTAAEGVETHAAQLFAGLLDGTLMVPGTHDWAQCLGDLGSVDAVLAAWRLRPSRRPWERRQADTDESYQARCDAIKSVVDVLAEGRGMVEAWDIVNTWGVSPHALEKRTIRRLVWATPSGLATSHPHHKSWQEALGTAAITLLEEAEQCLQVRWTGGEDGKHVVLDDEQVEAIEPVTVSSRTKSSSRKETTVKRSKALLKEQLKRQRYPRDPKFRLLRSSSKRAPLNLGSKAQFTQNV